MVFNWSLSDSKFPQVSRTLLSILAVVSNVAVRIVSARPPNSDSSNCYILTLKRCTSVNKRKNRGSRCTLNNNITRCPGRFESVGDRMPAKWDQLQTQGIGPSVTHGWATQPRWERSAAMVEEELGVNIAVCPRLQLISHTQQPSPFRE